MTSTEPRIVLREFRPEDLEAFSLYHRDSRYLEFYGPEVRDPGHAQTLLEMFLTWSREQPRRNFQWAVDEKSSSALIGCGGIRSRNLPSGTGEIGLELSADWWGRGLGQEVALALLRYGFEQLGLEQILGESVTQNHRVEAMLHRLGFKPEGTREGPAWLGKRGWTLTDWRFPANSWAG